MRWAASWQEQHLHSPVDCESVSIAQCSLPLHQDTVKMYSTSNSCSCWRWRLSSSLRHLLLKSRTRDKRLVVCDYYKVWKIYVTLLDGPGNSKGLKFSCVETYLSVCKNRNQLAWHARFCHFLAENKTDTLNWHLCAMRAASRRAVEIQQFWQRLTQADDVRFRRTEFWGWAWQWAQQRLNQARELCSEWYQLVNQANKWAQIGNVLWWRKLSHCCCQLLFKSVWYSLCEHVQHV